MFHACLDRLFFKGHALCFLASLKTLLVPMANRSYCYPHFTDAELEGKLFRDLLRSQRARQCEGQKSVDFQSWCWVLGSTETPRSPRHPYVSVARGGKVRLIILESLVRGFVNRANQRASTDDLQLASPGSELLGGGKCSVLTWDRVTWVDFSKIVTQISDASNPGFYSQETLPNYLPNVRFLGLFLASLFNSGRWEIKRSNQPNINPVGH